MFFSFLVVLSNRTMLINQNHIFIAQTSSSFNALMLLIQYTTFDLVTEALRLVTYVQLFQMALKVNKSNSLFSDTLVLSGWFLYHPY